MVIGPRRRPQPSQAAVPVAARAANRIAAGGVWAAKDACPEAARVVDTAAKSTARGARGTGRAALALRGARAGEDMVAEA